ncbi:MAG TPA: hypothetical protein GXX14_13940 [Clostridiaceae bacterium]|nr:hypothetical protein [Clostridiaceae bacterium]
MDFKDIERFKSAVMSLVSKGCNVNIPEYGIHGRVVGVGYKPYWTGPGDTIIQKFELNIINERGQIIPVKLNNVVGYKLVSSNAERLEDSGKTSFELHLFSHGKPGDAGSIDKVRVDFTKEDKKL